MRKSALSGALPMLVRHHHCGQVFVVEFPDGTRVYRAKGTGMSVLFVPWHGREVPVFDQPGELIVQLAEAGKYCLRLLRIEPSGTGR
jgi:hypothetical protein